MRLASSSFDGDYYGYDGPCPPWNDEIPHRHVLAKTSLTGRYTLNPDLKL